MVRVGLPDFINIQTPNYDWTWTSNEFSRRDENGGLNSSRVLDTGVRRWAELLLLQFSTASSRLPQNSLPMTVSAGNCISILKRSASSNDGAFIHSLTLLVAIGPQLDVDAVTEETPNSVSLQ
jgi:hypothetical protein